MFDFGRYYGCQNEKGPFSRATDVLRTRDPVRWNRIVQEYLCKFYGGKRRGENMIFYFSWEVSEEFDWEYVCWWMY